MVREFTELQGMVGGLYARAQGESDEIADAVYDHYRPVGLEDPIPRNLTGCAVALADKLDSVVGCFAVGIVPTGSSDPYALRRAALGIVKIILEKKLPISLSLAIGAAAKVQTHKRAGKYQEALETIAGLRKVVDRFFDGVMVMAENEAVRSNRLALLAELLREFTTVADFSEIGGEERR